MELDYYHKKVNVRVASQVAKRLKSYDLRNLVDYQKIPKILQSNIRAKLATKTENLSSYTRNITKSQPSNIPQENLFYLISRVSLLLRG